MLFYWCVQMVNTNLMSIIQTNIWVLSPIIIGKIHIRLAEHKEWFWPILTSTKIYTSTNGIRKIKAKEYTYFIINYDKMNRDSTCVLNSLEEMVGLSSSGMHQHIIVLHNKWKPAKTTDQIYLVRPFNRGVLRSSSV